MEIILEPGTAIAFDAGILVGEILDITQNDGLNAIVDISATCHMPDVLEAPIGRLCWARLIPVYGSDLAGQAVWPGM